jgi:hypothetical protein
MTFSLESYHFVFSYAQIRTEFNLFGRTYQMIGIISVVDTVFTIVVFTYFYAIINPWKLKPVDSQNAGDNPSDPQHLELPEVNTPSDVENVGDTPLERIETTCESSI